MEPTITMREAAERAHCDYRTIQREIRKGNLKAYRPGRLILIFESDFYVLVGKQADL